MLTVGMCDRKQSTQLLSDMLRDIIDLIPENKDNLETARIHLLSLTQTLLKEEPVREVRSNTK